MIIHDYCWKKYAQIHSTSSYGQSFSSFQTWANYLKGYSKRLRNDVGGVPKEVSELISDIAFYIYRIYGFEANESLHYVLDYFVGKRWEYLHWKDI